MDEMKNAQRIMVSTKHLGNLSLHNRIIPVRILESWCRILWGWNILVRERI